MYNVYTGILNDSVKNLDQILLIVNSFKTQMSDAKRIELINEAANRIDNNYSDLIEFNTQNILMSLQRSKSQKQIQRVQQLYQLQESN